jgi:hypothetical protein
MAAHLTVSHPEATPVDLARFTISKTERAAVLGKSHAKRGRKEIDYDSNGAPKAAEADSAERPTKRARHVTSRVIDSDSELES